MLAELALQIMQNRVLLQFDLLEYKVALHVENLGTWVL